MLWRKDWPKIKHLHHLPPPKVWRTSTRRLSTSSALLHISTSATTFSATCPRFDRKILCCSMATIFYFLFPDPDEEPEVNQVSWRLVQPSARDSKVCQPGWNQTFTFTWNPQEHFPKVVRVGVDQLQPQQPHPDLQIRLHTPLQYQVRGGTLKHISTSITKWYSGTWTSVITI